MGYKIIIIPVPGPIYRNALVTKSNITLVDTIIKDKKCIVTLVIIHVIYSIIVASLLRTHLSVTRHNSIMYSYMFLVFCNRFSCNKCKFELFRGRDCQCFRWMLLLFTMMRRMTAFIPTF